MAGICDDRQTFCFAPRALERRGPDPQGADVRPRRRRRQPRRGRQGVLVVPGLHADPLLDALALPLPAGRVPVRRAGRASTRQRGRDEPEYELVDTGVFDDDRYWAVTVDYAKAGADRHVHARSPSPTAARTAATLHVLPTLWFRNTWSWGLPGRDQVPSDRGRRQPAGRPSTASSASSCCEGDGAPTAAAAATTRPTRSGCGGCPAARRTRRTASTTTWSHGADTVNPAGVGTKGALHYVLTCRPAARRADPAAADATAPPGVAPPPRRSTSATASTRSCAARRAEADEFFAGADPGRRARPTRPPSPGRRSPG